MARLVIAFGGNALIREDERGTWPEQTAHALEAARAIARIGPRRRGRAHARQRPAGRRAGAAAGDRRAATRPALPFDVLDAMTQGEIGYLLQQALDRRRPLAADRDGADARARRPTTTRPSRPSRRSRSAPFYDEDEARRAGRRARLARRRPTPGRGWRRMVPSPRPLRDPRARPDRALAEGGVLVIAAGGGGIPVVVARRAPRGLDAVIDKDRCAAELAVSLRGRHARARRRACRAWRSASARPAARVALRLTVSDAAAPPRRRRVPAREHGPEDRGRGALRGRRRDAP